MTWSLAVNGIADTAEDAVKVFEKFRQWLADHSIKTQYSSFSGGGIYESNFHGTGPVEDAPETPEAPAADQGPEDTPAAPVEEGQEEPLASAPETVTTPPE